MNVRFGLTSLVLLLMVWTVHYDLVAQNSRPRAIPDDNGRLGVFQPLKLEGDIASQLVAGVDRFLLREINKVDSRRVLKWKDEIAKARQQKEFFEAKRKEFAHILGVRDSRVPFDSPEYISTVSKPSLLAKTESFEVHVIRLPVLPGMSLEGLLLRPEKPCGNVVVVPDADQTPEAMAGLNDDLPTNEQVARQLAERGMQVIVPTIISRQLTRRHNRALLTHREYIYRSAFELGRHVAGYEIQKVQAAVDWYKKTAATIPVGVWGRGEGGMLAMYAAALDERIDQVVVDDFVGGRKKNWSYPISRNVFGLLNDFGDAEVLTMISPRPVIQIHRAAGLRVSLPSKGGAPAELMPSTLSEFEQVQKKWAEHKQNIGLKSAGFVVTNPAKQLARVYKVFSEYSMPKESGVPKGKDAPIRLQQLATTSTVDSAARMKRQVDEMDRFNQSLLAECEQTRKEYFKKLDTSSPAKFAETIESYRRDFRTRIIGEFETKLKKFNPRIRKFCDKEKYTGYEVVLDVFDDVIAYGILLLPKGMSEDEKRPVVVCQHGLEGRPQDIVQGDHRAYHDFAAKLAEKGFITFSPQNLYIFQDRFRTLQRKANTIGKTLFSVIVPQHQQIVNWLSSLPNVDANRVAFYGLSYGGKSAMRIPPLVSGYCLSICSADFNDWIWKNASTSSRYSYVWTGEYEIFEFDLGNTFNYAEMATLIAPRPFMVERGHFDGVSSDERVAYEFAKVRFLYQARLKLKDRCEIEFFDGPHTINGQGTYEFLHKHLDWPQKD